MNNYLLVDDDEAILFLHEHLIKITDPLAEVTTMQSSVLAVQYLSDRMREEKSMPDCILVDLNMPEMNGFEFLESCGPHMKGHMQAVHIYMVSSSLYAPDRERALTFSFIKGFREKPLSREVVVEIASRLNEAAGTLSNVG